MKFLQYFPLFVGLCYLVLLRLHVSQFLLQFQNSLHQLVKV